ncbi:protocatechuate 3,4-dioxygenase subunit alpha [Naasia lichenicola]|uniref:Protocatechuate 3,4-dioxygenase subunit alpha n=1 Tax=Naasia lichenicola TaxID=2565933 RepID=A0A4S4FML8_9MICO|nr:protocatechuate 3,4-dioxygenase subunit alpha [Naasia lichenicola]THG31669.1 protocatechuate 3,4-dioxygenase subunit alpha [Naasia lichenicola]
MPDTTSPATSEQQSNDQQSAGKLRQTASQTIGPFYGFALPYPGGPELLPPHAHGTVRLHGTVYDGNGAVVPDALIELWQTDAAGVIPTALGSLHRDGYTFTGFGRAAVDGWGHFTFTTVRPAATAEGDAAFAVIAVFARGLLHHLYTRAYFVDADADAAAPADALLDRVGPERARTLLALADGPDSYRFDIRLQGEDETVFLDYPALGAPQASASASASAGGSE